jgi:hypothetical protein
MARRRIDFASGKPGAADKRLARISSERDSLRRVSKREESMRTALVALSFAAGSLVWSQSAGAVPARPMEMNAAATATSSPEQTHFYARRTRHHGIMKCYHEFLIGPYVCHTFYRWGW